MDIQFSEHDVIDLLNKVRIFQPDLGEYQFYTLTEQFLYQVNLSNGTIQFSADELSVNRQQRISKEQLTRIASSFRRTGPQRRRETVIPGDYSNAYGSAEPKKTNYKFLIIALAAAVVMGVAGAVFVLISSPESELPSYQQETSPKDSLNNQKQEPPKPEE
jgi:hypothetical protein